MEDAANVGTARHPLLVNGRLFVRRISGRFLGRSGFHRLTATLHNYRHTWSFVCAFTCIAGIRTVMGLKTLKAQARDLGAGRLCCLQHCARRFPNLCRIAHFDGLWDLCTSTAIVMVKAMPRGHVEVTMVPMSVSLADANDVADLNFAVFRDNRWFVAAAQSAGKCRHRWDRNNKNSEKSIFPDILLGWGCLPFHCSSESGSTLLCL